jgi:putative membrane protein
MLRPLVAGMVAAIMLTVPAAAQDRATPGSTPALSALESQFLMHAAEDNQATIQIALLAQKKAQYPATQAFARLMISDHALLENLFVLVAKGTGTGISDGIGPQGQQTATRLQQLQGAAFDTAFLTGEVTSHADDIMRFQDEEATSQNADVRRLAVIVIPILRQHLALAQALIGALESVPRTTGAAAGTR